MALPFYEFRPQLSIHSLVIWYKLKIIKKYQLIEYAQKEKFCMKPQRQDECPPASALRQGDEM